MSDDLTPSADGRTEDFEHEASRPSGPPAADATRTAGGTRQTGFEEPGTMIGNYRLERVLGEGGFGTVYQAEQLEPVKRRVALKIIKLGMDTREVIARFDAEKQALALMDHPGIAKVFDAGTTGTGRPYFVMEFVDGVPVTEYCDRSRLDTERRLELFTEISSAVQHAHQKGVIHRDIKPSNVLVAEVEGRPLPKVIDFGIAKATDARLTEKTLFTREAQFIGTPAYMSPEQTGLMDLDVDTRSDIYSLGVLLYEMLAGVTPFDNADLRSAGFAEIQRIIREDDPPRPSARASGMGEHLTLTAERRGLRGPQLIKHLKGELDWIVMKCLEKDRTRRYETANGLAKDIERYLADEPVVASPPSRVYRVKKLVRRNFAFFAAGTAMMVLLAAGVVGTSVGLVRAKKAEGEAVSEAAKSAQVARFLTDMLAGVGPSAARGRDTEMLEEILEETDAKIGEELSDQPDVEGEIRSHLGQVYFDLGRLEQAEAQYESARDLLIEAHGERDADVARQYSNLGLVREQQQEFDSAEADHLKALAIRREVFTEDHEDLAMNLVNLANLYVNVSRYEEAEPLLLEGLERMRRLHGDENENVAICLNSLGNLMQHLKRYPEAGPFYEEALATHRAILGDDHPYVITDITNLGWLALNTEDHEGAAARFAEAVELSRRVYVEPSPNLIHTISAQAKAEQRLERFEQAEALFRECIDLAGVVYGEDHASTAEALLDLGECLSEMGRTGEADDLARRAIGIFERTFGSDHALAMRERYNYAYSVFDRGDFAQAVPLLEASVADYASAFGREHKHTALVLSNLGRALRDDGRLEDAIGPLSECREIRERVLGPVHLLIGVSDHDLAKARYDQGRLEEAQVLLADAVTVYEATLDSTHRVFGMTGILQARIDLELDRPERSLRRIAAARPFTRAAKGAGHQDLLQFDALEGAALVLRGDVSAATALAEKVEPRLEELSPRSRALHELDLGAIRAAAGEYEPAERLLLDAHGVYETTVGRDHHLTRRAVSGLVDLYEAWAASGSAEAAASLENWRER